MDSRGGYPPAPPPPSGPAGNGGYGSSSRPPYDDRRYPDDRGYDRPPPPGPAYYDRGYDRPPYDRPYDRSYDRGYDRYDRPSYDRYDRPRSRSPPRYRGRSRSPPPRHYRDDYRRGGGGRPRKAIIERGTSEERARTTCLFVGNLPYSYVEKDVQAMFERFGKLRTVNLPIDRFTGRNKGYTFVTFEQRLDAEDALFKYHGFNLEGRVLRCDWDIGQGNKEHLKPGASRNPEDYQGDRFGGDAMERSKSGESNARSRSPHARSRSRSRSPI